MFAARRAGRIAEPPPPGCAVFMAGVALDRGATLVPTFLHHGVGVVLGRTGENIRFDSAEPPATSAGGRAVRLLRHIRDRALSRREHARAPRLSRDVSVGVAVRRRRRAHRPRPGGRAAAGAFLEIERASALGGRYVARRRRTSGRSSTPASRGPCARRRHTRSTSCFRWS